MKRPRRAKKTARKAAPRKKIRKVRAATGAIEPDRKTDPFHLSEHLIPAGWGYQWKIKGEAVPLGWSCVPFSRHAHDFPRSANYQGAIVIKGMILMEALKDQVTSELYAQRKAAEEQMAWARSESQYPNVLGEGQGFPLWPESEIVAEAKPEADALDDGNNIDVPLSLLIRVPGKWAAAAAYLNLTISEYCRRRIVLQHAVLAQLAEADGIYQPVNVHFTLKKDI